VVAPGPPIVELTTVSDHEAVLHELPHAVSGDGPSPHDSEGGPGVVRLDGLEPDSEHVHRGITFRTLPRPAGELLARVATVNDLHLGETECGRHAGVDLGPVLSSGPGEPGYPETMSRGAAGEIPGCRPDVVVAKGDLTSTGSPEEFDVFTEIFGGFGNRLHFVKGNHDVVIGTDGFAAPDRIEVELDGVALAVLDTSVPEKAHGAVSAEQLEWLDELGERHHDLQVLVFGHHHVWDPGTNPEPGRAAALPPDAFFGIRPQDSERLVEVFARRPSLSGYFAGHTHRNLVERFAATGHMPWVQVSAVKDYPGVWAEYRVFESGVLQVLHRISTADALRWTDSTRALFGGMYPAYSFGSIADRCFPIWPRDRGAP